MQNSAVVVPPDWGRRTERAKERIDELAQDLDKLSQEIWSHPELCYEEHHAHQVLTDLLEREGFEVTRHYILETAFRATYGRDGGAHVCVICEYDALPQIGHACGHNLIAECGAGAGLGIKAAMEMDELPVGRVTVIGTPAEEGGGGKKHLIAGGAFKEMDIAMMAHPYAHNVSRPTALSMQVMTIHFTGHAAHASATPWQGVNALDAAVMCYTSISVMRQQFKPNWRVHAIFTKGGVQPNIIPEEAELLYYLRTPDEEQMQVLKKKVEECARGAAMATGCAEKCTYGCSYANVIHNGVIASTYERHAENLGCTCPEEVRREQGGSTDMGNVSYVLPSIHPKFGIPTDSATHNPGFTKWAGMPEAQLPTLIQAKALALTALDLMDPSLDLLQRAKAEFEEIVGGLVPPDDHL
ncbi:xaa-Arg dipeptidase-like [Diadema antillarum]|uniref:xaa-Arg dipeptidase-like n=1 Tax=Diadema antillarum TaxID=105358 RepID=UPI003A899536